MSSQLPCVENAICIYADYDTLLADLRLGLIIPIAIEVVSYGIFVVLFGLSIYIFLHKFTPGKLYIGATFLFFMLATASIVLDLAGRSMTPLQSAIISGSKVPYSNQQLKETNHRILSTLDYIFLLAGLLGDIILTYRCYRLWNSSKRVIVAPILGLICVLIIWIINATNPDVAYEVYILITLGQNVLLTGLIAGRLWWQNRALKKLSGITSKSTSLLGPILESGLVFPAMLLLSIVFSGQSANVISPCTLTQTVGIASTMIMVRIGLGVDAIGSQQQFPSAIQSDAGYVETRGLSSESESTIQRYPYSQPLSMSIGTCKHSHGLGGHVIPSIP